MSKLTLCSHLKFTQALPTDRDSIRQVSRHLHRLGNRAKQPRVENGAATEARRDSPEPQRNDFHERERERCRILAGAGLATKLTRTKNHFFSFLEFEPPTCLTFLQPFSSLCFPPLRAGTLRWPPVQISSPSYTICSKTARKLEIPSSPGWIPTRERERLFRSLPTTSALVKHSHPLGNSEGQFSFVLTNKNKVN